MPEINDTLKRYTKILQDAKELETEQAKTQGKIEQLQKKLKDEYGFKTIKSAKAGLKKLETEIEETHQQLQEACDTFEEKWKDQL